jgi:hypothetical protein
MLIGCDYSSTPALPSCSGLNTVQPALTSDAGSLAAAAVHVMLQRVGNDYS